MMTVFPGASPLPRRLAQAAGLLCALALLAACGVDGEPETPTRAVASPSALVAR
jgi:hypothetical protein